MFGLEGYIEGEDNDDSAAAIDEAMRAALLSEELDNELQLEADTKQEATQKQNIAMEIVELFDAFKGFGKPIKSVNLSLQAALDGGPIPKKITLAGNKVPELKYSRIDDTFSDSIFKSLANVTFLSELDLSFNVLFYL
jgi:hypothetical protein